MLVARLSPRDGRYLVTGGRDRTLRLWNPWRRVRGAEADEVDDEGDAPCPPPPLQTFDAHGREVRDAAVSRCHSRVASAGGDRRVILWDVATGRAIRRFAGHAHPAGAVCFAGGADGDAEGLVASGGDDRLVHLWDARSRGGGGLAQTLPPFTDAVLSVAAAPRGRPWLAAAAADGVVRLYDARSGTWAEDALGGKPGPRVRSATCVRWSADAALLLVALDDGTGLVVDAASGTVVAQLGRDPGDAGGGERAEGKWLPDDGNVVVTLPSAGVARAFALDDPDAACIRGGDATQSLAFGAPVSALDVRPDGRGLVACGLDGTVKVYVEGIEDLPALGG